MTQAQTTETVRTISIGELRERLARNDKPQFWNVLTDEYFNGEMIPDSRRVPLDRVGRETNDSKLAKETEIVVYCAGPACPQSRLAAEKLSSLGYENVRVYEGGLEEWKRAGFEINTHPQAMAA